MASEITEHDQNASPSVHDDGTGNNGALVAGDANRGTKRPRPAADDDDDDDDKPGRERRKIEIKFIQDKSRRHITFSKRKAGIMKKVRRRPVATCESAVHPRLNHHFTRASHEKHRRCACFCEPR
jgi:MADS-box transcription factor